MSIRKNFIRLTSPVCGLLPLDLLCAITGQEFILPFYHIVSDEECPHVRHLYSYKGTKEFARDLDYLARHYMPLGADSLPDILAGKFRGKKTMLLTFDDGLRQMHDVVAPILLKKGIPAVFFINTDFIDNKALMFRYKASLLIGHQRASPAILKARNNAALESGSDSSESRLFNDFLRDYKPYMTAAQIKGLMDHGFAIGAHSCSHPYYSDLPQQEQLAETLDCLEILNSSFDIKQKLFAFPFTDDGVSRKFFDAIFEGGQVDFSFGSAGIKKDIDPRHLQRIPMEGWNESAGQIIKSEYLYYMLRAPFFRNRIKRD